MMIRSVRRDRLQVALSREGLRETVCHCVDIDPVRKANIVACIGSQLDSISPEVLSNRPSDRKQHVVARIMLM
jgi:hypothetical protein